MSGELRVGTSGWSYKHWLEVFYPKQLQPQQWLAYYSRHFDTVEINNTFYHLPQETTVHKWYSTVPEGFIFAMKLSRFITHQKKLRHVEDALEKFLERMAPLREKTGPILIQLPPNLPFHAETAHAFFELITRRLPNQRFAVEPRHESWFAAPCLELYREFNIALCIADSGNVFPELDRVTADWIYLRFHGRDGLYQGNYTEEMLRPFARKSVQWLRSGFDVFAYFNNDIAGFAVQNARLLREMIQQQL